MVAIKPSRLWLGRRRIEWITHRQLTGLRPFDKVRTLSVPLEGKTPRRCSAEEAVRDIKSGWIFCEIELKLNTKSKVNIFICIMLPHGQWIS